jgi:hypothetical protein
MKPFERSERIIFAGFKFLPPKRRLDGTISSYEFARIYERLVKHPKENFNELVQGVSISENFLTEQERALLIIAQTAMQELEKSTRQRMSIEDKRFWRVKEILIQKADGYKDELL